MHPRRLGLYRTAVAMRIGAVAIVATASPLWAQSAPARSQAAAPATATEPVPALLPLAVQFDIPSVNTGRTYRIYVSKPVVPAPAGGYGVLYVLDADTAFPTAQSQAVLASLLSGKRPILVVGISYPNIMASIKLRTRDLTPYQPIPEVDVEMPVNPEDWGGADAFHKFMLEELRPVIGKMATIDKSDQSLMGYSLGGLFALHVLLSNPEAYRNYVIGSPAIHYTGKKVLEDLPAFTRKVQDGKVSPRILVTSAELEQAEFPANARMVDNARDVAEALRKLKGANGYRVEYAVFADETHNSGIPASTSRGVAFVESAEE